MGTLGNVLGIIGATIGYFATGGTMIGAQVGFTIGSTIGNAIDPDEFDGPKLDEATVQTSRQGIPIPIIWGLSHIVGNIIQITPMVEFIVKTGSKKTGKIKEEHRKRSFAIGLARSASGPIAGIVRVWENNKLVYDVSDNSIFSTGTVDGPFGIPVPFKDNAAFEAATTFYNGSESQLPDPILEAHTGVGTTPAYRGLPYIVFNDKDLTAYGSAIPTYRFELSTGVVVTSKPYPITAQDNLVEDHIITDLGMWRIDPITLTEDFLYLGGTLTHVISYQFYDQGLETLDETFQFLSGTLTQVIDYQAYDQGLETLDETFEFLSGTLTHVIGYIFIDQPPDNVIEDMDITGITLT